MEFLDNNEVLVEKWIKGTEFDKEDREFTYFFLNDAVELKTILKKGDSKEGESGWISKQIPPNRCVTFEEYMKQYKKQQTLEKTSKVGSVSFFLQIQAVIKKINASVLAYN